MTLPLADFSGLGAHGLLVVGFVIGIAFGACLERSGLGSPRKLMGQFDLSDLAVFKVMFSAILTAMLGLFWLSRFGVLDLRMVYLPDTFLLPQLVGGAVFGVGFALAGLCPGTSCVAAATGRVDGAAVMLGMFGGVLAAGLLLPSFQNLYVATARGGLTLPRLFGIPEGVVVLAITGVALTAFAFTGRVERAHQPLWSGTSEAGTQLSSRGSESGTPLSSRRSEASVGIYPPDLVASSVAVRVDPDTPSLRSLVRDDTTPSLRSLVRDDTTPSLRSLVRDDTTPSLRSLVRDDTIPSLRSLGRNHILRSPARSDPDA